MSDAGRACVLDASALLALLYAEPGAEVVEQVVEHAALSTVNWSEIYQRWVAREVDVEGLGADVEALGLEIVPFTAGDAEQAADLWPRPATLASRSATGHAWRSLPGSVCLRRPPIAPGLSWISTSRSSRSADSQPAA